MYLELFRLVTRKGDNDFGWYIPTEQSEFFGPDEQRVRSDFHLYRRHLGVHRGRIEEAQHLQEMRLHLHQPRSYYGAPPWQSGVCPAAKGTSC